MNIKREFRTWGPFLLLLLVLVGLVNYQRPSMRQARLDAKLVAAVHSHDANAVVEALNAGANPNMRDYYRPLPTLLIRLRHPNAAREDDQVHAQEWEPILTSAVIFGWEGGPNNENGEIIEALLNHGAQINSVDFGGSTALSSAVGQGNLGLAKDLLNRGAAVNTQDRYGFTPLMNTGWPPSGAMTRLLLTHGANPNLRGIGGETALMSACTQRSPDVVRLLLQHGADPTLRETPYKGISLTALQMEQMRRLPNPVLVQLLSQSQARWLTSSRRSPCLSSGSFRLW